ncbi:hypothetical protein ILP97_44650 [Amycolatopsis sp. H6(2020)]|nr:hypothetical protein [Amycolatopsis sp. H6(2020)]
MLSAVLILGVIGFVAIIGALVTFWRLGSRMLKQSAGLSYVRMRVRDGKWLDLEARSTDFTSDVEARLLPRAEAKAIESAPDALPPD